MRRFVILLITVPLIGNSQTLSDLMATSSIQTTQLSEVRVNQFIQRLSSRRPASEITFLRKVFHQTQKTFLDKYTSYAEFSELFNSGQYDCLTATALFSIVLDQLDFTYSIIETNYHIFLLVKTSKGEILLETTDRFHGFIRDSNEIQRRIGSYRRGITAGAVENKKIYHYSFDLYHEVNPQQLPGLLFYNQAVKAYNAGKLERCAELLIKAKSIYDTPRINEFASILSKSVEECELPDQTKGRILQHLQDLTHVRPALLAAR